MLCCTVLKVAAHEAVDRSLMPMEADIEQLFFGFQFSVAGHSPAL
jgi:hypothetical protein